MMLSAEFRLMLSPTWSPGFQIGFLQFLFHNSPGKAAKIIRKSKRRLITKFIVVTLVWVGGWVGMVGGAVGRGLMVPSRALADIFKLDGEYMHVYFTVIFSTFQKYYLYLYTYFIF